MHDLDDAELQEIGRQAAREVDGLGTVDAVRVTGRLDSADRPAHVFSFLVERDRDPQHNGLAYIRLVQRLRDALLARGDAQYPFVRLLDRTAWDRHSGA